MVTRAGFQPRSPTWSPDDSTIAMSLARAATGTSRPMRYGSCARLAERRFSSRTPSISTRHRSSLRREESSLRLESRWYARHLQNGDRGQQARRSRDATNDWGRMPRTSASPPTEGRWSTARVSCGPPSGQRRFLNGEKPRRRRRGRSLSVTRRSSVSPFRRR
jgi:hypothetical protein